MATTDEVRIRDAIETAALAAGGRRGKEARSAAFVVRLAGLLLEMGDVELAQAVWNARHPRSRFPAVPTLNQTAYARAEAAKVVERLWPRSRPS